MPRPSSLACTTAPRVKPAGRLRMAAAQFPSPRRPRNAAAIPTSPSFRVAAPAPGPAAPAAPRPSTANGGAPRVKPAGRLRGGEMEVGVAASFGGGGWPATDGRRVGGRDAGESGVWHRWVPGSASNGYDGGS